MDRQTKRVLFSMSIVVIFFIYIYFFAPTVQEGLCLDYRDFKEMEINGVVVQKFRNPNEHSYPTLMIKNFDSDSIQSLNLIGDTTNTYDKLKVFDTIFKKKGEILLYLKEHNSYTLLDSVDFGCSNK